MLSHRQFVNDCTASFVSLHWFCFCPSNGQNRWSRLSACPFKGLSSNDKLSDLNPPSSRKAPCCWVDTCCQARHLFKLPRNLLTHKQMIFYQTSPTLIHRQLRITQWKKKIAGTLYTKTFDLSLPWCWIKIVKEKIITKVLS